MRIASISKSLTMAVLAKLVEEGKVNLGKENSGFLSSRQKGPFFSRVLLLKTSNLDVVFLLSRDCLRKFK